LVYKKILVGFDGSDGSWKALRESVSLAKVSGSELRIVVVHSVPIAIAGSLAVVPPNVYNDLRKLADDLLEKAMNEARESGVAEVTGLVLLGPAAQKIVSEAQSSHADLVVVGSRGLSGLSRLVLGSVSSSVVNSAHVNVLVVK
jgi:nucleotide-binding universal stress UspA family protein